jgi:hypothetical protein
MQNVAELHKYGYCKIDREWNSRVMSGLTCINADNTINYRKLNDYIEQSFLPGINNAVPVIPQPVYGKFRFSDNTNAADASTFHGDMYNFTDDDIVPMYTCLVYFDDGELEVVPGTHRKSIADNTTVTQKLGMAQRIKFRPGDMLIFHANMHHRGVGYSTTKHRRLLQVFDIFPSPTVHAVHNERLYTMKTSKTAMASVVNAASQAVATVPPIINALNAAHYVLVCNNIQYKIALTDVPDVEKNGRYISYEPGERKPIDHCTPQEPWNVNIIVDPEANTIEPSSYYSNRVAITVASAAIIAYVLSKSKRSKRK